MAHKKRISISDWVIALVLLAVALTCLLPLIYELALSLSSNEAVVARQVGLVPVDFTWSSYQEVFRDGTVLQSLWFSVWSTALFTAVAMFLTVTAAYPLTRPEFRGRKFVTTLIVVTMYFSGGILPLYILVKSLGLLNTVWAIILPLALSPFNLIILKTSVAGIPDSMTEAALMDGASYWQILLKVILPLSAPILATLSLFYAVGRWNTFQDALFYLT
jgi:putative aldouronate transport system permease protein